MRISAIALAAVALATGGCSFERHWGIRPGEDQVVRVESGDRLFFDLDEPRFEGRWDSVCDDSDVEVQMVHAKEKAKVTVRVHRGYDGPSNISFFRWRNGRKESRGAFNITLYKRTGDAAFWE